MRFDEFEVPADMTEGDAIDFLRLTGKASGLRSYLNKRGPASWHASAVLERVKSELRDIRRRYA